MHTKQTREYTPKELAKRIRMFVDFVRICIDDGTFKFPSKQERLCFTGFAKNIDALAEYHTETIPQYFATLRSVVIASGEYNTGAYLKVKEAAENYIAAVKEGK